MTDTSFVNNSTFAAFEDIIHHTQNENIVLPNNLSLSNFTQKQSMKYSHTNKNVICREVEIHTCDILVKSQCE